MDNRRRHLKLINCFFVILLIVSIFNLGNVLASSDVLKIDKLDIVEKSENAIVDVDYSDDSVENNIKFHNIDDYVVYKITLKNLTDKNYTIKDIVDDNSSSYVLYEYNKHVGEKISSKGNFELLVKVVYKYEVTDLSRRNQRDKVRFTFFLVDENGNEVNPKTGDNIFFSVGMCVLSLGGLILLKFGKDKTIRNIIIVLAIGTPILVKAYDYSLVITFNNEIKLRDKVVVNFDSQGGVSVDSVVKNYNEEIGNLPETSISGSAFDGWYTEATSGVKVTVSEKITDDVTYYAHFIPMRCKIAETLHTKECTRSSSGCKDVGYYPSGSKGTSTITYGNFVSSDELKIGDALDCDVNGDGEYDEINERFYYIKSNGNNAVLIYFSNFEGEDGPKNENIYSYDEGLTKLPTTTQWSNVPNTYGDYAARLITMNDLNVCGNSLYNVGDLDSCTFMLENTRFESDTLGRSMIWITKEDSTLIRINSFERFVVNVQITNNSGVRPIIEIPINDIEKLSDNHYFVNFDANGGEGGKNITIKRGASIDSFPDVEYVGHTFEGWYTDLTGGVKVEEGVVPTDNVTYYARWNALPGYIVSFDSQDGVAVGNIFRYYNEEIGSLPVTSKGGYKFDGWYTEATGGTKITGSEKVTDNVTYFAHYTPMMCKISETLHTEVCTRSSSGCKAAGYSPTGSKGTSTITYGNTISSNNYSLGDALDCDVNGDGQFDETNERFYYIKSNGDNAILIYYSNFEGEDGPKNENIFSYDIGLTKLPTTTQWSNLPNHFGEYSARFASRSDLDVCGDSITTKGGLDSCIFLFENSRFSSETLGRTAIWLQKEGSTLYRIFTPDRYVVTIASSSNNGVRPVIEVPLNDMEKLSDNNYIVTFDANGGTGSETKIVKKGASLGSLPEPSKTGSTFEGWYTDLTSGTKISDKTIVSGNVTYYAKWS